MTTPQKDTAGSGCEAFEDYARRDGLDVTPRVVDSGLTYLNSATEHAWQFWQASRRHLPEINISRYDEADYGGMKPKAKGEWVRYEDAQEAVLRASQPSGAAGKVPKPLDDPRLQQLFGDAIEGALALGYQNSSPPPDGHWLWRFWDIGRAEAAGGEVVREFVNELGNTIRITIEGPTSTSENVLTPMEGEQLRGALNELAAPGDGQGGVAAEVLDETSTSIHATIYAPVLKEFCLEASREDEGRNWYIEVTDESGYHTYDGYWRDSALKSCAEVLAEAAEGSMLHEINPPPERVLPLAAPGAAIAAREQEGQRRIYIAGPMTGLPERNFPAFHAAAAEWRAKGWHVESPAEINAGPVKAWLNCMRADIPRLVTCDAIYLLPGWQGSNGASLEAHIAKALGMEAHGDLAALASPAAAPTSQPNAAAQEQQAGWISVDEQLPPAFTNVLAYGLPDCTSMDKTKHVYITFISTHPLEVVGDEEIEFWQPLPPAPTGMGSVGLPSGRGEEA